MADLGAPWGPEHQAALVGGPLEKSAQYMLDLAGGTDVAPDELAQALLDGMVSAGCGTARSAGSPAPSGCCWRSAEAGRARARLVSSSYAAGRGRGARRHRHRALPRDRVGDDVRGPSRTRTPTSLAARALGVDSGPVRRPRGLRDRCAAARAAGCLTIVVPCRRAGAPRRRRPPGPLVGRSRPGRATGARRRPRLTGPAPAAIVVSAPAAAPGRRCDSVPRRPRSR